MREVSKEKMDVFIKDYEKDIFKMLMALGMKMYHPQILKMAGTNPFSGSIVTAAMAARIIKQEVEKS